MRLQTKYVSVPLMLLVLGCGNVRATRDFTTTHEWAGHEAVQVRVRNGNVELRPGTGEQLRISGRKYVNGLTLADAQRNLEQLVIHAGAEPDTPEVFVVELRVPEALKLQSAGADLVLELPAACKASVKSSNGSIRAERLLGPSELATSNGNVRVRDVQGDLCATTSNGRVIVTHVAGDVQASSSNGDIEAEHLGGSTTLNTSNGDIRLVGSPPANGRVELHTSNGCIDMTFPRTLAAELKLRTALGHVHVALGDAVLQHVDVGRNRYNAIVNGGGGLVAATTSNGSITLNAR